MEKVFSEVAPSLVTPHTYLRGSTEGGANPLVVVVSLPSGKGGAQVSQETTNRSFDDLARALAEGSISRRRALKLFAGTALAAMIPSTRAMAAITCPPGQVKICHVPRRADGTCRRGAAETRCVSPEEAATHAGHPCVCCGGCGG